KRLNEIDNLDAGFEHLQLSRLLVERGSVAMDWISLSVRYLAKIIDGLADDIQNATQSSLADRHGDWPTGIVGFHSTHHAIRRKHRDRADAALAQVLLHLRNDFDWLGNIEAVGNNFQGLVNGW